MPDCLFCRIIAGEIPATKVHEDDRLVAFNDIAPKAPMHVLVVPRRHIETLNDLTPADDARSEHVRLTERPRRRRQ